MANQADLARHLDCDPSLVSRMIADGTLPSAPRGQLDIDACRVAYIRHLREVAAGRKSDGGDDGLDLVEQRARLAKAQADSQEMKNAQLRGELIQRTDVVVGVQGIVAHCRARLLAIPTKAAPRIIGAASAMEAKELLTELVHEAIGELSSARVVALRSNPDRPADGGGPDGSDDGMDTAAAPDRKRVGRPKPDAVGRGQRGTRKVGHKPG